MYLIKRAYVKPRFDPKHHKSKETVSDIRKIPPRSLSGKIQEGFCCCFNMVH